MHSTLLNYEFFSQIKPLKRQLSTLCLPPFKDTHIPMQKVGLYVKCWINFGWWLSDEAE